MERRSVAREKLVEQQWINTYEAADVTLPTCSQGCRAEERLKESWCMQGEGW